MPKPEMICETITFNQCKPPTQKEILQQKYKAYEAIEIKKLNYDKRFENTTTRFLKKLNHLTYKKELLKNNINEAKSAREKFRLQKQIDEIDGFKEKLQKNINNANEEKARNDAEFERQMRQVTPYSNLEQLMQDTPFLQNIAAAEFAQDLFPTVRNDILKITTQIAARSAHRKFDEACGEVYAETLNLLQAIDKIKKPSFQLRQVQSLLKSLQLAKNVVDVVSDEKKEKTSTRRKECYVAVKNLKKHAQDLAKESFWNRLYDRLLALAGVAMVTAFCVSVAPLTKCMSLFAILPAAVMIVGSMETVVYEGRKYALSKSLDHLADTAPKVNTNQTKIKSF